MKTPPSKLCTRYTEHYLSVDSVRIPAIARCWEISDAAAEQLAQSDDIMPLLCLRKLTVKAARHLATSNAIMLCLDSLDRISNAALEALVEFKGNYLSIGLLKLSDEQAEILSGYSANDTHQTLALNGLSELTPTAADHLNQMAPKKKSGLHLALNGLPELSDKTADALRNFGLNLKKERYPHLGLDGIAALSPHAAQCLTEIPGACGLELGSVRTLSVEACKHLASKKHTSNYRIEGLDSLSVEAAKVLAKSKCQIYINVSRLADDVVAVLEPGSTVAGHSGNLSLTTDTGWYGDD